MKLLYKIPLVLFIIIILQGCGSESKNGENVSAEIINETEEKADEKTENETGLYHKFLDESIIPKINIENNDLILYIQNINLDFDTEEEQVIVEKDPDIKNKLRIIVVDFDSVRNKYITTWETFRENVNPRTFIISYADVVGDHNMEILFRGTGSSNEQILAVYRKTHSPAGISLYYENIAEIIIDGQIEIIEKERSSAYLLGQKNGISFPVITYERDEESENLLDMVKKTFIWNYQSSRFIKSLEEKIPGEKIEEERLEKLFVEDIDAYQDFLQGQWVNNKNSSSVISFDRENNEIAVYSDDILEIYKWTDFTKSRMPQKVYISARNDLIHFIRKNILITIEKLDRIRIVVNDREIASKDIEHPWNGAYERINSSVNIDMEQKKEETVKILLEGSYTGVNDTITFSGSDFTQTGPAAMKKGVYSVFDYNGKNIIEFRYLDSNRLVKDIKEYSIEYSQFDIENKTVNEIRLQHGEIKAQYFDASGEDKIIYKQTIEKENN